MEVIGRQWEQERVDGFLDMLAEGSAALVLEGDPGIGKTTLWRAALDAARGRSYCVLVCRASESESALPFLGLGDLLEGVSNEALVDIPEPQREALELALLRSAGEDPPDRVSLARGALSLLRALAFEGPTVLAIDDVHWLDPPSADVLRFIAHRLSDERLGLLVSVRSNGASSLELERSFPGVRLVRVRLEPLSLEELEEVVRVHVPVRLTRPTWSTLYRTSGGNPFFAIQLAEALERRGERSPGQQLPIPETLAEAVQERFATLSPGARTALLPIAALAQPTLTLVRAGAADPEGMEEALRAGVLQLDGERIRFAHPLLASYVYEDVAEGERRELHALLASLVTDPEERALHLGRGTVDADESVAATLERAADLAARRGNPEIAAELAEHSVRLTPDGRENERSRRIRRAAGFLFTAGDGQRGLDLLGRLVDRLPPSEERARALRLLAAWTDDLSRSVALLEQALREAGESDELRSRILTEISRKQGWRGRWDSASTRGREAVTLAERSDSRAALAGGLARLAWAEVGRESLTTIERAVEIERSLGGRLPFGERPEFVRGTILLALDRFEEARAQFEESYERAVALGDMWRSIHLGWLAELELRAGNWESALAHARATRELGLWGMANGEAWGVASNAQIDAHLGDQDAALRAGEHASHLTRATGFHFCLVRSETALGVLHLSTGQASAALDHLVPLLDEAEGVSPWDGFLTRTLSNAIEALVGTGDLVRAELVAGRLEEHARSIATPSAIAADARSRALVLAESGDLAGACAAIEIALAAHASLHEPFELARTHLVQGTIERRAKQKAAARAALGKAEAIFAGLGARLWLERVERELARTGLVRSLDRDLTPTELRVAELASAGAQNKEIAGALFISVKTVEANLTRVYAKLGIRSRTELASQLSKRDDDPAGELGVER